MKQQLHWNSVSETKHFTTLFQCEEFSRLVSKESTILDMGCGYGRTLDELYHLGYCHLTGIDLHRE